MSHLSGGAEDRASLTKPPWRPQDHEPGDAPPLADGEEPLERVAEALYAMFTVDGVRWEAKAEHVKLHWRLKARDIIHVYRGDE